MNNLLIFFRYIFKLFFEDIINVFKTLNKPKIWIYLSFIIFTVTYFMKIKYSYVWLFAFCLFLLWHEYIKGDWMHDYREEQKKMLNEK